MQNDNNNNINNKEIQRLILQVFGSKEGQIVLNYYKKQFETSRTITDFSNSNRTFFNLGRLSAIEYIANDLQLLIDKNDKKE
jgi:hypothetical protein